MPKVSSATSSPKVARQVYRLGCPGSHSRASGTVMRKTTLRFCATWVRRAATTPPSSISTRISPGREARTSTSISPVSWFSVRTRTPFNRM